jgi:hypothetical protein
MVELMNDLGCCCIFNMVLLKYILQIYNEEKQLKFHIKVKKGELFKGLCIELDIMMSL